MYSPKKLQVWRAVLNWLGFFFQIFLQILRTIGHLPLLSSSFSSSVLNPYRRRSARPRFFYVLCCSFRRWPRFCLQTLFREAYVTSDIHCLSTIMKCISLGAVDFLHKPISEDKLRNIWQHVVHKAFNNGGRVLFEPLKLVKESSVSTIPLEVENGANSTISNESKDQENDREHSTGCDKYPAPSTPQLNHGARLFDDKDCQDQTNCLMEKEDREGIGECKSVETTCTCGNSVAESTPLVEKPQMARVSEVKKEEDFADKW